MQGSAGEQGKMLGEGRWLDTQSLGKKRKIMRLEEAEWALPVKDFLDPLALIHLLNKY